MFILTIIFSIEWSYYSVYNISNTKARTLKNKAKPNIRKIIRKGWRIIVSDSVRKNPRTGEYEIYVRIHNNKINKWTNDFIIIDKDGKILKEELTDACKFYEKIYKENGK